MKLRGVSFICSQMISLIKRFACEGGGGDGGRRKLYIVSCHKRFIY